MTEDSTGVRLVAGDPNSKWALMTAALNQVVAMTESTVNWGLKFFGSGGASSCTVDAGTTVSPAPLNAAAIAAALAAPANQPATNTPTRAAEISAGQYLSTLTTPNPKFILLATDGLPNCAAAGGASSPDEPATIQAVGSVRAMGFDTFVIGMATSGIADFVLDSMALNGGRPRAALPQYYPVSTTGDLVVVLTSIQGMVANDCTLPLRNVPVGANINNINVLANSGTLTISADPVGGWSYGPGMTTIVLNGSSCSLYRAKTYTDVRVTFGCL